MKTHQPIIVVTLSCLLMLTLACGKKSIRSVSGVEDLSSSEGNNEVTEYMNDRDFSDDPLVQFDEALLGDGGDAVVIEETSLSSADLEEGSSSMLPYSKRNRGLDSSGGVFGTGNSKDRPRTLTKDGLAAYGSMSGASVASENTRRTSAHFSQGLQDIFYVYDSWRLSKQSHRILESNATWLKAHPHARVTIEGHCDERGTQAYNYVLGERRAETAQQYLSHLGVPAHQIRVVSFGKDRPVCHVFSDTCFQSNRRAHFSIDMNTVSRD